jgi:integrase
MARLWAASLDRDLDTDLSAGPFLSVEDADHLADFLRLSAADQHAWCEAKGVSKAPSAQILRLEDFRPNHRSLATDQPELSDPGEAAARIRWVATYIDWHLQRRLGDLDRRGRESGTLLGVGEAVVARLRSLAPRAQGTSDDDIALEGVPREVLQAIEDAMVPGAPTNPFRSPFLQARNYLYWRLLLDTGARRAEARHAKAEDIVYATRRFIIRVSKTRPRTVPIGPQTAEAFDRFMNEHWSRLPQAARRRGYLFTDEKGGHLSLRSCNRIFERVREHVPGVPEFLAPHTIRRSWNDAFSERVDAQPPERRPSEKREVEMRNRLQGWTGQSSMGARYAKRHIRRQADRIAEELAASIQNPAGDIK